MVNPSSTTCITKLYTVFVEHRYSSNEQFFHAAELSFLVSTKESKRLKISYCSGDQCLSFYSKSYTILHTLYIPALFFTSSSKALGCMDLVRFKRPTTSGVRLLSGVMTGKRSSDTLLHPTRQLSTHRTDTKWIPFFNAFSRVDDLPSLKTW